MRAPQRRPGRNLDVPPHRPVLRPPSRDGHALPLGGCPDGPRLRRQLAGADDTWPASLSRLAGRRWVEEARVHPAARHAHHTVAQSPEHIQAGVGTVPHHHERSARTPAGDQPHAPGGPLRHRLVAPPPFGIGPFRAAQDSQEGQPPCAPGEAGLDRQLERQPAQALDLHEEAAARPHRIAVDPLVADAGATATFDGVVHNRHDRLAVRPERLVQQAEQDPRALQARPCPARQEPMEPAEPLVRRAIHRPQRRAHGAAVQAQQRPRRQGYGVQPGWPREHRREGLQPSLHRPGAAGSSHLRHGLALPRSCDTSASAIE